MKRRLLLGAALGAFFLYLALPEDPAGIWEVLDRADYRYLALFLVVNLAILWIRVLRWSYLLRPVTRVPPYRLLSPLCIGLMLNFPFPGRVGEFARAYLVGRREGVSKSAAFATVVVERLLDGLAIISLFLFAPFFLRPQGGGSADGWLLQWAPLFISIVYLALFFALVVLSHHREAFHGFVARSAPVRRWRVLRRVADILEKFTEGLAILRSWKEVFGALGLSFLIWGAASIINLLMMRAVGMELPFYAPFFLTVMQMFGVLIPSPGFVGPYQYAHIVALSVYGVPESEAFGLAILIHAGYFFTFVGAGLYFFFREHLSWGELRQASKEKDKLEKTRPTL